MRVRLVLGVVADCSADVLVRVAPSTLVGRTVDPVLAKAGPAIADLCRELRRGPLRSGLAAGEAVRTPAGDLAADWLVHVAVPTYSVRVDRTHQLTAAYRACLRCAEEVGARTLVLPALGGSAPYWPLEPLPRLAVGTLLNTPTSIREATIAVSSPGLLERFAEALLRR